MPIVDPETGATRLEHRNIAEDVRSTAELRCGSPRRSSAGARRSGSAAVDRLDYIKGPSPEEETLRTHPEIGKSYRFASITKGREYFAGVLFVSSTLLAKRSTEAADRLRLNTLYVALTRFRDEVTVTYSADCTIASLLETASQL